MFNLLIDKYKSSGTLLKFFFLTYVDKVISFALPLSILFIIKDKALYTVVEVVFSYATIAMVVAELGFSNYLFFGYKKAEDKPKFIQESQLFFKFLLLLYCLLAVLLMVCINYFNAGLLELFILVCARTLFTLYISFYSNIYRLNDKPSGIYALTISVNVLCFLLLMFAHSFSWQGQLVYFFLPVLLVLTWVNLKFVLTEIRLFHFRAFIFFLWEAIKFSWPVILNVLAMTYMNNYAKIYSFERLTQEETLQISYIMRVGLIIQLTHTAFASFFSKTIFMDETRRLNFKMLSRYSAIMVFSTLAVFVVLGITNYFFDHLVHVSLSFSSLLFVLYIILWCYIGYLEIYFGVMNANRRILYYSIISSLLYTVMLLVSDSVTILQLGIYMILSASLNLALVIMGLKQLGVIGLKAQGLINKNQEQI